MITLLGVGLSTRGVADFELRQGRSFYWLADSEEKKAWEQVYPSAIWVNEIPSDTEAVIVSPGIPPFDERVKMCKVPIMTDIDWCFRQGLLQNKKTVAVTGTNGKSSFVSKLSHVLTENGVPACVAGNIGISPFDALGAEVVIFEVSSFQLHYMDFVAFDFGVMGQIRPDHLDWHGGFNQYQAAKEKLILFSQQVMQGDLSDDLVLKVAQAYFGVVGDLVAYQPLPFRMQVDYQNKGWLVINDSKATNMDASLYALRHYQNHKRVYLICGGILKEPISEKWVIELRKEYVIPIFQGESAQTMYDSVKKGVIVRDYSQAIKYCQNEGPGVILFSPAGSSFDQFRDYEHRGKVFQQEVKDGFTNKT